MRFKQDTLNFPLKQDFFNTDKLTFTSDELEHLEVLRQKLLSEEFQAIAELQLKVKRKQLDEKLRQLEQEQNRLKLRENLKERIQAAKDEIRTIADQARRKLHIKDDG